MNKPPFPFPPPLDQWVSRLPPPPEWLRAELLNRVVLLLNHVLMQEPAAMDRLRRQQGKTVRARWGAVDMGLQATPAGLLATASLDGTPDLELTVAEPSPLALAQRVLAGDKPAVDIRGDVQLAAEVAWLVDNVRWDIEEDLSRLLGDAAAHTLVGWARGMAAGLKGGVAQAAGRAEAFRARATAWRHGADKAPEPAASPDATGAPRP